jgi:DNA-binding transcriptional LysR family regulator
VHIRNIDLNLFVLFDAIYSEGNLTRAGEKLNLTQPAVSHALGRLRSLFRDPLFARRGNQMVPTALSRSLIGQVRTALQTFEVSLNENRLFNPAEARRTFNIGLSDVLEVTVLPPLMECLQKLARQIEIVSVRVRRREIEPELTPGILDLHWM